MARKRKAKADSSVTLHLTIPAKLVKRLDAMHAKLQAQKPYSFISRSGFYSHCLGEWVALIDDPEIQPTLPVARRRVRPPGGDAHP